MAAKTATKRHKHRKEHGPGAHAFWSGTISFGLVSIPVSLFPTNHATRSSLRLLAPDGTPLQRRYFCPAHDRDVHPEHILRGYELENGQYVVIRDEELEAIEPRKSHVIDLRQFVERSEISPAYFERAYVLTPGGESPKAYLLLAAAMEDSDRVGIATFVMRDREYLVAILAEGGILRAQTLRFHDEIRSPADIDLPKAPEIDKSLVTKFKRIIHNHVATKLADSELHDEQADRMRELAERKRKRGVDVVESQTEVPESEETEDGESKEVDLLDAIRRSLQGHNGQSHSNGRHRGHHPREARSADNPSKETLLTRARRLHIPGRSEMTKQELSRAIRKAST
jgi:DNA end-binding protein Ku